MSSLGAATSEAACAAQVDGLRIEGDMIATACSLDNGGDSAIDISRSMSSPAKRARPDDQSNPSTGELILPPGPHRIRYPVACAPACVRVCQGVPLR